MPKTQYKQTWCQHMRYDDISHWQFIDCNGARTVTTDASWLYCPACAARRPLNVPPVVCCECGQHVKATTK